MTFLHCFLFIPHDDKTKQVIFAIPLIGATATHIIHILYEYGIHTIGNEQRKKKKKKEMKCNERCLLNDTKAQPVVTVNGAHGALFFLILLLLFSFYILFSRYEILYSLCFWSRAPWVSFCQENWYSGVVIGILFEPIFRWLTIYFLVLCNYLPRFQ